jgi:phosphoribosylformylglycinamidine synthase subunit PurQ / glutaminase
MMRFAILTFPGTWSERDCQYMLTHALGQQADLVWHKEADLDGYDAVVIPGGFSYGDHLRTGAIARFSPVMEAVGRFAAAGKPVLGICNGFQILCESGLLPGALIRNRSLRFICRDVWLRVERSQTIVTAGMEAGETIEVPIKHGEGQFVATSSQLAQIEDEGRVVFRYASAQGMVTDDVNPNGSVGNIAGVRNDRGNVVGLMPHPEHAVDPDVGPTGGQAMFASLLASALEGAVR